MANEAQKAIQATVKCKVSRVSNPADLTDIFVGENGQTWLLKPGKLVELPKSVYNILKAATTPYNSIEEDEQGNLRTRQVEGPEYAISVEGVEDSGATNARIAALAKESAAKVDTLTADNEILKKKVESLESDAAATLSISAENEALKKRIAELEAAAQDNE